MRLIITKSNLPKKPMEEEDDEPVEDVPAGVAGPEVTDSKPIQKSLDMVKSFTEELKEKVIYSRVNALEYDFLKSEGHSEDDIVKGLISITGKNRHKMTEWLLSRARTSVSTIMVK